MKTKKKSKPQNPLAGIKEQAKVIQGITKQILKLRRQQDRETLKLHKMIHGFKHEDRFIFEEELIRIKKENPVTPNDFPIKY